MKRPKLKIELEPIDKVMEFFGFLGLLILIILPIYFFDKLPETIPIHYGAKGMPDGFGGKEAIWLVPIIGLIIYFGLIWINKYPHAFNYTQKVTKENARRLYTNSTRMIRILNAIITGIFAYITYSTIQTALGNQNGLGNWFLLIFLILTLGTTGYFFLKSTSKSS